MTMDDFPFHPVNYLSIPIKITTWVHLRYMLIVNASKCEETKRHVEREIAREKDAESE